MRDKHMQLYLAFQLLSATWKKNIVFALQTGRRKDDGNSGAVAVAALTEFWWLRWWGWLH